MKRLLIALLLFALMGCGTPSEPATTEEVYGLDDYDFSIVKIMWVAMVDNKVVYTVICQGEESDIEVQNTEIYGIGQLVLLSINDHDGTYMFHEYVPFVDETKIENLPPFRVNVVEVITGDDVGEVGYIVSKDGYTIGGIYTLETEDNQ